MSEQVRQRQVTLNEGNLAFMALRLRNPRVRLHKYPFISTMYHNLTLHIIMSAANSTLTEIAPTLKTGPCTYILVGSNCVC